MKSVNQSLSFRALTIIVLAGTIASCSNRAIYEGQRISQRNDCLLEPVHMQEECMAETRRSFDEYEQMREAVLAD